MCEAEPTISCSCDKEVYFCVLANALGLNIVNVELERHFFVDGAVGAQGFEAVEGDEEHCENAACSYATIWFGRRANHAVVLNSTRAAISLDGEAEEGHGEMVGVSPLKEGVVADACEKIVLVPDYLGTS